MTLTVKQKIMAFGKQYRAFDGNENQVFEIRSMLLSPERRKEVYDMAGRLVAWSEWPVMSGQATMETANDRCALEIPFVSLSPEWQGDLSGKSMRVSGDFFRRNYNITVGGALAASIGKRFLAFSDTYEVDVNEAVMRPEFALLLAALIDHKYHSDKS